MTSELSCSVYLQLPASLEVVACGRFDLTLLGGDEGVGRFVYGRRYRSRADAVPIDPIDLPITDETFETTNLGGVFGVVRDALPDAWGRLAIERVLDRSRSNEAELLLQSPEDRVGALSFGLAHDPPAPARDFNRIIQLGELREAARIIEDGAPAEEIREQVRRVLQPATSLGGARPKNTVEDDAGLWVAKFPARGDRWNSAAVEAAMLSLAARCDIRVPELRVERLGDESVLLLRRFDREKVDGGYHRHRMASALTMLRAGNHATDNAKWSYLLFADELQRWSSRPAEDKAELYRRIVFNALISNSDDHARNHAVIAAGREWRLSPAYDLTPNPQPGIEERCLALACGHHGRAACRENIVSAAPRFGLDADEANALIDRTAEVIRGRWRSEVLSHGGSERDCELIAPAFMHAGFEYPVARQ
jgi:serine/threonine-protein kinase HipA